MTRPTSPLASPLLLALVALTACGGGGDSAVTTEQGLQRGDARRGRVQTVISGVARH